MKETHHCVVCGNAFVPAHADEIRCPAHGGQGELVGGEEKSKDEREITKTDLEGEGQHTLQDGVSQETYLDDEKLSSDDSHSTLLYRKGKSKDKGERTRSETVDSRHEDKPLISYKKLQGEKDISEEVDVPVVWQAGDRILDLYEVKGEVGKGGFGVVYRVHHTGWDIDLAVKSPLPKKLKKGGTEDFVSEAEDWMDLGLHPHITTCHYVRTLGGVPRVFAELVEGGSLHDWMAKGRLYEGTQEEILKRLLDIAVQFAWGLDYAHEQGMIHQDVKPENVLMTEDGRVKVTDFGLLSAKATAGEVTVKAEDQEENKSLRVKGKGMTPAYCSPEQSTGQMLSRRTDLWSWGLSILALFAGERFWGKQAQWATGPLAEDYLKHYLEEGPKRTGIPPMPEGLVALLQEVFQEDPDKRPHDMDKAAQRVIEVYEEELGKPYPREKPEAAELRADSLNNRALSLMDLGRYEDAKETFKYALEADPSHPQVTYNYGLQRWRMGKITDKDLIKEMQIMIESHPGEWEPRYLLALVHVERDDCQGAIDLLSSLSDVEKKHTEVQTLLEKARGRLPEARRLLDTYQHELGWVLSVYLSDDEQTVLSGISSSSENTIQLWNVDTGECIHTFEDHKDAVCSVCLSKDSKHALSGSKDATLKLWDVSTGNCLRTFRGHDGWVNAVDLHPAGRTALSGSSDKTLKLWDIFTGECICTFEGHEDDVKDVCFGEKGDSALSGSMDTTMKLWDVEKGKCLRTFRGQGGWVLSVDLNIKEKLALSGGIPRAMKLWDVESGECLRTFAGGKGTTESVCLGTNGRYALSGNNQKSIQLWEVESGKCLRTFEGHEDPVESVQLSADGRFVISGGQDASLKRWKVDIGGKFIRAPDRISKVVTGEAARKKELLFRELLAEAEQEKKKGSIVEAARLVKQARSLVDFDRSKEARRLWGSFYKYLPRNEFRWGWKIRSLEGYEKSVGAVCLNADGRFAISGGYDHSLKLWDVESEACVREFSGHQGKVNAICFSPDENQALSGSQDQSLKLWDVNTGQCLQTFEGHEDEVSSVCLSPDQRYAISSSLDLTLKVWDIGSGNCIQTLEGHEEIVTSVDTSADGKHALSGGYDNTLRLWNIATGECKQVFEGHQDHVNSVCMSADGRHILSGSGNSFAGQDFTLRLWQVSTGDCIRIMEGHEEAVTSACMTADGRTAVSGSKDKTIRIWNLNTGECIHTFTEHEDVVNSVCLSADDRYLLSGGGYYDRALKVFFMDWALEEKRPADWDEGARPYLENFLVLHTSYAAEFPQKRNPSQKRIQRALRHRGRPVWTEDEFQRLLSELGCRGYGWLRPEGVRKELRIMADNHN